METKIQKLLQKATGALGESDICIIVHKDGQCAGATHGNIENIAQAMFACMHQPDSPLGQMMYRIIKLNVLNILANPSPYAVDLTEAIVNAIPENHD